MKRTTTLNFFEDDNGTGWGVAPDNSIHRDNQFNSPWNHRMIFHDVFEHYFEDKHKYFMGDYGFNVAGEMVAAGHYAYYATHFSGFTSRRDFENKFQSFHLFETINGFTESYVEEAIVSGYSHFGSTLESRVPRQKYTEDYTLECAITEYQYKASQMQVNCNEDDRKWAVMYKKSCTAAKIANLHRYGYYMAQALIPWTERQANNDTINGFLDYWKWFTINYNAEDLQYNFKGLEFTIETKKGILNWDCHLIDKVSKTLVHHLEVGRVLL